VDAMLASRSQRVQGAALISLDLDVCITRSKLIQGSGFVLLGK